MSLTAPQQAVLRDGHPHASRFFLSVLKPAQVYCGTISGSPAKGARTLTLVDVSGDITDLAEGMTLYVGTSAGDKSVTKRRYRSRASQVIKVDDNAITWVAGQYVTVYKNWELWGVMPRIVEKPFIFYKDYDVTYSDQNDDIPPVAIGGGPFVGFLDGGSITFNLDASKSYGMAVGAAITTYLWECTEGTIADANVAVTTLTLTTAQPNGCWLDLTVSDGTKSQKIHIPVFVHERDGANVPVTAFSVSGDLQGDWKTGGYTIGFEMWDKTVIDDILEGAYCVLWKESTYAGVEHYYGNNANIQFAGYIQGESIVRNPQSGTVTFDLCTINGILDSIGMPSVSIEESDETPTWYRFPERTLTVARAIHHLWRWHSTLLSIADVFLPIELTDTMPACDDFENGSLYSMVDGFSYEYSVFAKVCCDCAGRVYVEQDINVLNDTDRAAKDVIMTLEDVDRRLDTDVEFTRNNQKVPCVTASGYYLDGSTYKPIMSACPGGIYADIGIDVSDFPRLLFHDQTEANRLSGRLFSMANQDVLEVRMSLAGDYPVELVPQVWWHLHDMDTKRADVDLEDADAVIRHIAFKIDTLAGTVYPDLVFEPEAPDLLGSGETVIPPVDPTTDPLTPVGEIPIPEPIIPINVIGRFGWTYVIGDGSHVIQVGCAGIIEVPYYATPDSVKIVAKPGTSGTISIDVWKCSYAQIAAGVHPVVADSICGVHKIVLTAAEKAVIDISDWIKTWNIGDHLFLMSENATLLSMVSVEISGVANQ